MIERIIGIDPSISTFSFCILDREQNVILCKNLKSQCEKMGDLERYRIILSNFTKHIDQNCAVFMEGYSYASTHRFAALAGIGEMIKYRVWNRTKRKPHIVAPTTLKKFVTGSGKAQKHDMVLAIFKKWGREFDSVDEAEAFALAKLGAAVVWDSPTKLTRYEREVINKLRADSGK